MKNKTIIATLLLVAITTVSTTAVFGAGIEANFEKFCEKKLGNDSISSADFICDLDIYAMDARITDNTNRIIDLDAWYSGGESYVQLNLDDVFKDDIVVVTGYLAHQDKIISADVKVIRLFNSDLPDPYTQHNFVTNGEFTDVIRPDHPNPDDWITGKHMIVVTTEEGLAVSSSPFNYHDKYRP